MPAPKFQDATAADLQELSGAAPQRRDDKAVIVNSAMPALADQAPDQTTRPPEQPEDNPANVVRQPPDTAPQPDTTSKLSPEIDSLTKGFDELDNKAALERAKTPEQREAERVAAEEQAAAKKAEEATAAVPEAAAQSETDMTIQSDEEELKNPQLKARDRKRYKELLTSLKAEKSGRAEERTAREALEAKVKELEAKGSAPTAVDSEELKKLREEHAQAVADNQKFRRRYEVETDPEIAKRFDEPVKKSEESISSTLKAVGLGAGTIETIAKEGGFAKFARSNKVFTVTEQVPDPDNEGQTKAVKVQRTAAQLASAWMQAMNPADAEAVRVQLQNQIRAEDDKKAFIESETAKANEHYKALSERGTQATAQQVEAEKKILEEYHKWVEEQGTKNEWLKPKEIAANATAEQKAAAEEHNKFVAETKTFLSNPLRISKENPNAAIEDWRKMVFDAAEARYLRRQNGNTAQRIKDLEAQVARLQKSSATVPKQGSILPSNTTATKPAPTKKFDPMRDDPAAALDAAFNDLAKGRQ